MMKLTAAGQNVLARSMAGATMTFTYVRFGDSTAEQSDEQQAALTNLVSPKMTLPISSCTAQGGQAVIECHVNNSELVTGFRVGEIGLFAKINDEAETLYAYNFFGDKGDWIPAPTDGIAYEYVYELKCIISNEAQVTAIINTVTGTDISLFTQAEMNYIFPNQSSGDTFPAGISVFGSADMNYIFPNPPPAGEFPQGISVFTNPELNYIFS
ncbi:MAG: hypothetical protein IKZ53_06335 [Selenomonadaceae bacterium]|nr:hypothetical protein [Selenomonadaceae bacterium]